ncbi:succinylglutamate desuccinylase/aspartoacylase family protein [Stieleria sp. ICT_E10.1]|uniref:succinylglutamate desuccinylase/aspartoacylase family protein n=1 Tax=Stieleria sedimenti TaxID=2976331 RepID=UPI0021806DF7|nr:succinylglutamate desuccinylase/aspartoacylase family protein [Stieleria sedimenti]MCS7466552.1 succinylglutamate desuccinylase/aspartoacylase family protein [Stieleria sedimenti]
MNEAMQLEFRRFGGSRVGPNLLITAGVHGDEYLPMLAVGELIRRFDSDDRLKRGLRGTLTLIPIVNRSAYRAGRRVGDDGRDLARTFPGRQEGTVTERVADALSRQIADADFYIDLHSGGTELCVLPLAGYMLHANAAILQQQRKMACVFGLPVVWGTSAELQGRSLSVARDAGIPAIYVEYLGAHRERAELSNGAFPSTDHDHPLLVGCLNVMRHLEMLPGAIQACEDQQVAEDWRAGSGHMQVSHPAPTGGFLTLKVKLGQRVSRGELLAEIESPLGGGKHAVVAEQDGIVVVLREYPRINEGDSLAVVVETGERS